MSPEPVRDFIAKLAEALADGTFVRLVFSRPARSDAAVTRATARLVDLKRGPHLSFTLSEPTRDRTENVALADASAWVAARVPTDFRSALLLTTVRDWQLSIPEHGAPKLVRHKASTREAPAREHNRRRAWVLDESANDWLAACGIVDASGRVKPSMTDKHRQIQRYVELLSHLAAECGWSAAAGAELRDEPLAVADMGCGKGYLTFGAWHLFHRMLAKPVRVIGVEARPELARDAGARARTLGTEGLEFASGSIEAAELPPLDALIALHACDTATDDAIRRGVQLGAKLIVVAPCCHRELRPQLGRPEPLAEALRHGILAERMAEWGTDALRAAVLEWAGYATQVLEFVPSEHTPKNLMIAAIRKRPPFADSRARDRITALKSFLGVTRQALDPLLAQPS